MSTYAIGDVQGCYNELQRLLERIDFKAEVDRLWFTGDLVNRGPRSLEVLQFVKQLGDRAITVLGNHDLHLLSIAHGQELYHDKTEDTLLSILHAPDGEELLTWLRHRPVMHYDEQLGFALVHAGLPPQWDLTQAKMRAQELEEALRGARYRDFLNVMYGNKPKKWSDKLEGFDRLRYITNCFTRLRYCNAQGKLALEKKDSPKKSKRKFPIDPKQPWFSLPNRSTRGIRIVFGHWATLGYHVAEETYGLDTGCVWGGSLTALRLDDLHITSVPCQAAKKPKKLYT